eukprot:1188491-Prorocentrum_minimum.AAC.2
MTLRQDNLMLNVLISMGTILISRSQAILLSVLTRRHLKWIRSIFDPGFSAIFSDLVGSYRILTDLNRS